MASNRDRKRKVLDQEERSIASFQSTTGALGRVVDDLAKVVSNFQTSVGEFQKTQKESNTQSKKQNSQKTKETANQKKVGEAMKKMEDIFGAKNMKIAGKLMGRDNFRAFSKSIAGVNKGGAGFGKGMLGKAAKGLSSIGGSILRAAGPIGAVLTGLKMAYDFWNSGGLAKLVAGVKMATNKGSMLGAEGIASTRADLEGTEEFRKIDAKYAYQKPLELKQALTQDYFNWEKGVASDNLQFQQGLVKDDVEYQFGLRKDALQFELDQAKEALDAELDRRKAISAAGIPFISKYASISERALKAIGSSTKQIIEGLGKFTSMFGLGVKSSYQLTENAQGLAYHLNGSDEDVMNMTNLFRLMGKTSAGMAQDLIAGFSKFAEINDIAPQVIFNQIREAGEDIYKFSNGTADNFAKQAVLLTKMSVSMSQMMKASDTMVLNYKDSIKAEMSLSAMLGKNVNLSEVRARLMSGDQSGAASALKTALGGVDINAMNAFQKQALQQATGMDISALMGLQQGKEGTVSGELKAESAKGKAFADGALKQDISNQAAKLALDQQQRKKLLEFEQRQRFAMLMLEQQQRLDSIQLEAAYRAKWELQYAKEFEKDMAAASANVEAATNILASKGTRTMMEQAFTQMGIATSAGSAGGNAVSQLLALQQGGYLTQADLGNFAIKLGDKLEAGNVNMKDTAAVEKAITAAMGEGMGSAVQKRTADVNKQMARIENIAVTLGKSGGSLAQSYIDKNKITKEEIALAKSISTTSSRTVMKNSMTGPAMTYGTETVYSGVDAKKLEELKKANLVGTEMTVAATNQGTAQLTTIQGNGQQQLATQNQLKLQQTRTLTEFEYTTKLQQELVAMTGLSLQMLNKIMENTAQEGADITLDGRTIRNSLLNQARRGYAVARDVAVA